MPPAILQKLSDALDEKLQARATFLLLKSPMRLSLTQPRPCFALMQVNIYAHKSKYLPEALFIPNYSVLYEP